MSTCWERAATDIREEIQERVEFAMSVKPDMTAEEEKKLRRSIFQKMWLDTARHWCQFSLEELGFSPEGDDLYDEDGNPPSEAEEEEEVA